MKPRTKKLYEGILFLIPGAGLITYSIYDSHDGSFIAGSKYGISNTLSITNGQISYWFAVGFRIALGCLGIYFAVLALTDFKKSTIPYK